MKKDLILIGGGDHCKSVIDVIEQGKKFFIKGIIDIKEKVGSRIYDYPVIGTDDDLQSLSNVYSHFFITIGHIKNAEKRIWLFERLRNYNANLATIISPLAYVSKHAKIGPGTIVFPFSIVDVDVVIGANCIINHATTVGHGAIIEDHCHVSANCVLGKCLIGSGTFIGGNCWVNNTVSVPSNSIIGSATNIVKTIELEGVYIGNPARKIS